MNEKPIIGITTGDLNGIGLEVIIKTLSDTRIVDRCTPVIFANVKIVSDCTPEQRKHDRQAYLEMKEKNEKNEDDGFLYILVGRPGEKRTRRVRKRTT